MGKTCSLQGRGLELEHVWNALQRAESDILATVEKLVKC